MSNSLDIINHGKINSAFIKANQFLLDKYNLEFSRARCKNTKLEELWLSEFGSILKKDTVNNVYNKAVFKDSESLMMFLLRWG